VKPAHTNLERTIARIFALCKPHNLLDFDSKPAAVTSPSSHSVSGTAVETAFPASDLVAVQQESISNPINEFAAVQVPLVS
jgi:hypothetical protein